VGRHDGAGRRRLRLPANVDGQHEHADDERDEHDGRAAQGTSLKAPKKAAPARFNGSQGGLTTAALKGSAAHSSGLSDLGGEANRSHTPSGVTS
jgi:hypothetical protein